jgi:hypothetical protein
VPESGVRGRGRRVRAAEAVMARLAVLVQSGDVLAPFLRPADRPGQATAEHGVR